LCLPVWRLRTDNVLCVCNNSSGSGDDNKYSDLSIVCVCATTAVAGMTTKNTVTSTVAAVMVKVKLRTMATAAMELVMAAMVARTTAVTASR
jgi:hypothetical protein